MYYNQFVICNKNSKLQKLYSNITLNYKANKSRFYKNKIILHRSCDRVLYYKNLSNLKIINKNTEDQIIIIGLCISCTNRTVDNMLSEIKNKNIEEIISNFTGNYIIIYKNMIYKDFCNLQKLYTYKLFYNNEFFISNNALIFKNLFDFNLGEYKKFGGHREQYCSPGTSCYSKVKTLYNSQKIDINGNIYNNKLLKLDLKDKINLNKFLNIYSEYCKNVIKKLYTDLKNKNKNLFLALTGGKDSRMILSVILNLKIPITIITFKIKKYDIEIAIEICKKFNLKHILIDLNKLSINEEKKELWDNIIGNELLETDNEIIQKEALEKYLNEGDCIIFGNGPAYTGLAPNEINDRSAGWGEHLNDKSYIEYQNWVSNNNEDNIHLKLRYFIEILYGSWLSIIQQSYDMLTKYKRFCFPVCEKIVNLSLLLGNQRNKENINQGIIKKLMPELDKIRYSSGNSI